MLHGQALPEVFTAAVTVVVSKQLTELRHDMKQLEHRTTIKLGSIVCIAIGATVALTKLIN